MSNANDNEYVLHVYTQPISVEMPEIKYGYVIKEGMATAYAYYPALDLVDLWRRGEKIRNFSIETDVRAFYERPKNANI